MVSRKCQQILASAFIIILFIVFVVLDPPFFSSEFLVYLVAAATIALLTPRFGFYLARYILGRYYKPDNFGKSYAEYRRIERRHCASRNDKTSN
jgi:hypothetical protein